MTPSSNMRGRVPCKQGAGVSVAMDVMAVQLEGVDLKEEEVKQELLVIEEVLIA